ncbi:MAG: T9SS type A sorting domain-containing protein [Cytophagaceae bacterium]
MKYFYPVFALFFVTVNGFCLSISDPQFDAENYPLFGKAEATFTLDQVYSNPYDPDIIKVDAIITEPGGNVIEMPCFYYIPATYMPAGWGHTAALQTAQATWMLRFAPRVSGSHSVQIRAIDDDGTWYSATVLVNAEASAEKGFVRIDPSNQQFMRHDNGDPYYPIGVNLGWNSGHTLADSYEYYLSNLAPNNANWGRYWLTDFARQALEWSSGHWSNWYNGLGRYSQQAAGVLDAVMDQCADRGMYMQLVFQHHGQFSTTTDAQWADNPYNTANGGYLNNAGEYFSSAVAREQTKKQYRYIIARWAYSSNILAWELFNEVEYTNGSNADIAAWHAELSQFVKEIDPYDHIITTSTGRDNSTLPLLDQVADLDQLQWHTYSGNIDAVLYGESRNFLDQLSKPILCGEFGTATVYNNHPDDWGDHVRTTMWTGMFSHAPNMFWYWNQYIDEKNLYHIFQPLGAYLDGVDIVSETGGEGKLLGFDHNPALIGTVSIAPGTTAWAAVNDPDPFITTIDGSGNAEGLHSLSSYIKGAWGGGVNRDVQFNVNFQDQGSVTVNFGGAGTPNNLQVFVDGVMQTSWNVPAGGGSFTLNDIPAGSRTIRFYNAGSDWVNVSNFNFNNVSLNACRAYGYTGSNTAYGYVKDLTYGQWADPATLTDISGAALKIGPLDEGVYQVEFFDPKSGATELAGPFATVNDSIVFTIPDFIKDMAFKVSTDPMPVELASFDATLSPEGQVLLSWSTASEVNSKVFEVQRSSDGTNFETIGSVTSTGNSSSLMAYNFNDNQPLEGMNFYRLRMVDLNDSYQFSQVVSVNVIEDELLFIFPNPAGENINVKYKAEEIISISIYNMMGMEVLRIENKNTPIHDLQELNLSHLVPSVYIINIHTKQGKTWKKTFIKE